MQECIKDITKCESLSDRQKAIPINKLVNNLVDECKNFEATWISEKEAVFSVDNSEKELKKIFGSWGITVIDKN